MDAVDLLILALRLVFVALLYLFLLVVVRMAVAGLRPATPQRLRLRVVEPGDSPLQAGEIVEVAPGMTLGRGQQADVVLADDAISATHARVDRLGRGWAISDLGSTNGTRVNDAAVRGRAALSEGDVVALGTVRFDVVGL